MKIALCSDLHLEFQDIEIPNTENADVLILSGDIMIAQDLHEHPKKDDNTLQVNIENLNRKYYRAESYRNFLSRVSNDYKHVIYIPGNHEFYHGSWVKSLKHLCDECSVYPNVYFLERNTKLIDDVLFIGGTLWTDLNKHDPLTMQYVETGINDYRLIRNDQHNYSRLRSSNTLVRHTETLTYFKHRLLENKDRKCVIVGHHAPTHKSIHERYLRDFHINGGYASDLSEFILDNPQIALWTCGHMHDPHSYYVGDTLVACNPRGYAGHDVGADSFKLKYIDLNNMPTKFEDVNWSRD
jgi:Icc-related predicted phosphoesterase